ncbi:MAG TPA: multicopper oxidase domain-containing protein, partial [Ilumatobacteraceae bacterium]
DDAVLDRRTGPRAELPGPAPREGDQFPPNKPYREIAIAIQDRSFREDGALFYPDTRAFFDGVEGPYRPSTDVSPIWNPEFFGNTIMVNGATWPYLDVEQRRYRFRMLNGCQSRFLILDFDDIPGVRVWSIGNEGGFLVEPMNLGDVTGGRLLMAPAERADLIVDFTDVPVGSYVLRNLGPDDPFGGGEPGVDFTAADPLTTGRLLEFRVAPAIDTDTTTPPEFLALPEIAALPEATVTRRLALVEEMSSFFEDAPVEAKLGTVDGDPAVTAARWTALDWDDAITENPAVGATEVWELYNMTGDAHPMHVHEVTFEVLDRQQLLIDEEHQRVSLAPDSSPEAPAPWESGRKDTVIAPPGQVTRIKAEFTSPGQYVWHCHIVEHEDNEMMRPYRVGPEQPGQPAGHG